MTNAVLHHLIGVIVVLAIAGCAKTDPAPAPAEEPTQAEEVAPAEEPDTAEAPEAPQDSTPAQTPAPAEPSVPSVADIVSVLSSVPSSPPEDPELSVCVSPSGAARHTTFGSGRSAGRLKEWSTRGR